jgi:hypothetical protein
VGPACVVQVTPGLRKRTSESVMEVGERRPSWAGGQAGGAGAPLGAG